ncbi:MAG: hypothetical protein EHM16_09320 [Betaproteobacteria bacterium]|nr:MAG: hypothetical protein EHM16_09320 [Betaproteobacteria bacterium]
MSDLIIFAVTFLVLAVAAFLCGALVTRAAVNNTAVELQLRDQASAEGKLTPEELDRRHATVQSAVRSPRHTYYVWRWHYFLLPVVLAGIATGFHAWLMPQKQLPATTITAPSKQNNAVAPVRTGGDMQSMTKRLADRLEREPNDGQGWALLARAYTEIGEYPLAETAFAKAAALLPPDASLNADWASVHVMARGGQWDEQAFDLVKRALAVDPKHLRALGLAGSGALHRGDHKLAREYWTQMKAAAPPDSPEAKEADANLNQLNARLREKLMVPDNGMGWIERSVKQRRN